MLHCCCLQTMEIVCRLDPSSSSLRCPGGGGGGTATIQVIYIYKMTSTYLCIALIWIYIFLNWAYFYVSTNMNQSKQFETSQDTYRKVPIPSSYLPTMQLKFQSCFEIKSRRIIMCVRQVFCQWFIIFYWSECPSWFVIIYYSFM